MQNPLVSDADPAANAIGVLTSMPISIVSSDGLTTPTKFGIPRASESMDLTMDQPCCLCDVAPGDSKPMVVKRATFCQKKIGQSVPYPCANNTLTVTISATTKLYANLSMITIKGIDGAEAPTGNLRLIDKSGGQGHHLMFAPAIGGAQGYGHWHNGTKTLTLQVLQDMDCSGEYLFAFTIKNQQRKQAAQSVQIEAKRLHLYHLSSVILPEPMIHDLVSMPVPRGSAGDAAPMYIWDPVFNVKTATARRSRAPKILSQYR